MKTLDELLLELGRLNIKVWADGNNLRYQAPLGILTPDLLAQIKVHKTEILAFLNQSVIESQSIIKAVDATLKNDGLPLSFTQQQFWLLHHLEESNYIYNMVRAFRLEGALDIPSFERAIQCLIERHSILKTEFKVVNGSPVQVITPHLTFDIPVIDLQNLSETEQIFQAQQLLLQERTRAFDLNQSPVWRVTLIRLHPHTHLLMFNLHHIICDDWSIQVFLRELSALYQEASTGKTASLPELPIQYADFAYWQNQQIALENFSQQLNYWHQQLADLVPVLELPYLSDEHNHNTKQAFQPSIVPLGVSIEVTCKLKQLSQQSGTTLFTTLLTAFAILLSRYTHQEDLVIGTGIANRTSAQVNPLIGAFVNTLGLRIQISDNPTFRELLTEVKKVVLEAYAHSEVPFIKVIEALKIERRSGNNPLLQVMFILETINQEKLQLPGIIATKLELSKPTAGATFDLTLNLWETNSQLQGKLEYNAYLFNEEIIQRISEHFQTLLAKIVESPDQRIGNMSILSATEKEQLIGKEIQEIESEFVCLHQLFEAQVKKTPEAVALKFEGQHLTYRELNEQANQLANHLQTLGVKPEAKVGICVERSLEMIVGILGILKAGGAYVPLDSSNPQERLNYILEDAQVQVLVTNSQLRNTLDRSNAVVYLDEQADKIAQYPRNNLVRGVRGDNLAYMIYTSGSTGNPKGVLITHHNVVRLFKATEDSFQFNETDIWTLFHSFAFDFSVWELWGGLLYGGCVLVVPYEVSRDSQAFYNLLVAEQVTVLNQTPSAFYQLIQVDEHSKTTEKLSLRVVIFGGEALSLPLLQPWFERHGDQLPQLVNMYGITETTVHVTIRRLTLADVKATCSLIGQPIPDLRIYLLDKYQEPVPIGVVGEIYVGGGGVARGYWRRTELTEERFVLNPFSNQQQGHLYKTGDLARYLPTGELEYKGRIDHQVKIRGFRIELGEIQALLSQHQGVRECVVLAREDEPNNKRLVAYIVPGDYESIWNSLERYLQDLRHYLNQKLPYYMIPSAFVVLEKFPLTSNGKVDSRALPIPKDFNSRLESSFVPPNTPTQEILANLWAAILSIEKVGIYDNFFELGGHSLLATQVISRLRTAFQIELPLRCIFESPTVAQLSEALLAESQKGIGLTAPPILPVSREKNLPLSWAQQRLWFLHQLESESSAYTIPFPLKMSGKLNVKVLEQALQKIVQRHEVLRTNFQMVNNQPVQVIVPHLTLTLPVVNLQNFPDPWQELEKQATLLGRQPFDLAQDAVIRVRLWQLSEEEYVLLVLIHHIAGDGWSLGVFMRELSAHYQAINSGTSSLLPELSIQYADFAVWQRQWLTGQVLEHHLSYWQQQLADAPLLLALPTDRPRPAVQTFCGAREYFQLDQNLTQQLKQLSQKAGTTLFMTLLAAFVVLLSRISNQTDIVIGSPIANRNRQEIESLIGFFVNILALRFDLSKAPNFEALLAQVREVTIEAYVHQDLPFEMLVETLQIERNLDRNPLVQVTFALQNAPTHAWDLPGLTVQQLPLSLGGVRFDLEMHFWEVAEGLKGICFYNTDLFDATTISRMAGHFQTLLKGIVADPGQHLTALPLLTEAEQHQLLLEWNNTQLEYPQDKCIHQLFEDRVKMTPNAVAVAFKDPLGSQLLQRREPPKRTAHQRLTYKELNAQANQLARYLQKLGVGPEVLVGICIDRSLEMVVGLLGIIKAGGAYVALDPAYPKERLTFMLSDSQVSVLLTQQRLVKYLPQDVPVVCLDKDWEIISQEDEANLVSNTTSQNLVYVVYTSGSTGKPKGVQITHRNLVHSTTARITYYQEKVTSFLLLSSFAFDSSVAGIFWTLCSGGTLCLPQEGLQLEIAKLVELIAQNHVSHLLSLPSLYSLLLEAKPEQLTSLRTVIVAGESCPTKLVQRHYQLLSETSLFNEYGPTEGTVWSSVYHCHSQQTRTQVSIGCPIPNTQIYILDSHLRPVPIGVIGEIYISGDGLARGYLNQPALTSEKFIPNPFENSKFNRLYKTGDLGRYLPDGNIELLTRIDNQVKIRGFRIELGEIEAVLSQHPLVQESVVIARENISAEKYLVAYLVANIQGESLSEQVEKWENEQVIKWQKFYQENDSLSATPTDLTFNITGWDNSYTGQPIPAEEMREWVNKTVDKILALSPGRVLEIGCGTGLLLCRIAPHCQEYWGIDYSQPALQHVEQIKQVVPGLERVKLLYKLADDFEGIPNSQFDTVIINSVVQYFPSADYLLRVVKGAMTAIGDRGTIFIGDVRSLPLLDAYHALVQLSRASKELTVEQWQQKVHQSVPAEEELVISPAFFLALQQHFPQITQIEIQLKRGHYHNELTQFRYDVTLHLGKSPLTTAISWLDWQLDDLTLAKVHQRLLQEQPEMLGIRHIPNSRVQHSVQLREWLQNPPAAKTVGQLQQQLMQLPAAGVDPEQFWELSEQVGYTMHVSWWNASQDGCYDVVFSRSEVAKPNWHTQTITYSPWNHYTNNPLRGKLVQKLVPQVREFIQQKLPNYMMPQAFVILDALPLTPNGKVDRRALPSPNSIVRTSSLDSLEMPQTKTEQLIADVWQKNLQIEKVALDDNFFDLGGNSLRLVQVREQLQTIFTKELSIVEMFQYSTVRALGQYLNGQISPKADHEKLAPDRSEIRSNQVSRNPQRNIRQQHRSQKKE